MPALRAKTPRIQAQTTAMARAMARICNDETGCLGVQGGHGDAQAHEKQNGLTIALMQAWP
jgi:hypothetical protein